jgi:hypothetical protein
MRRRLCGPVLLALVVVAAAAIWSPSAVANANTRGRSPQANLQPLWSAFPLGRPTNPADRQGTVTKSVQARRPGPADTRGSGGRSFLLLALAAALLVAAAFAALAFPVLRPAPAVRGWVGRARSKDWPQFRPAKGGLTMGIRRRRQREQGEPNAYREQAQEQAPSEPGGLGAVERLSDYSVKGGEPSAAGAVEAPDEPAADLQQGAVGGEGRVVLDAVAEEVGMVLKTAHEAATTIYRAAQEEADRVLSEAESAGVEAKAEAYRLAEADRAEGNRVRAEADTHAKEKRAAANAFAEERRRDAEEEAAKLTDEAHRRLRAADAEIDQKVRQADAELRQRMELLQAGVERYEERLESILVVFRGMVSQLEDVLEKPEVADKGGEAPVETLEDALRPDVSGERAG